MFCVVLMNCECDQNITATVLATPGQPSEAECKAAADALQRDTLAEFRAGTLPPACPHCGSRFSQRWTVSVHATTCSSAEELHRRMEEASRAGRLDALAAIGERAMRNSTV